jgi:endonuclease I
MRLLLVLLFVLPAFAQSKLDIFRELYKLEGDRVQLPEQYKSLEGLEGRELFDALHKMTGQNFVNHEYREAKHFMYNYVDNRDDQVYTIYSGLFGHKDGNKFYEYGDENQDGTSKDFVNCEHVWPQSKFDKIIPMVSDIHHLYPSFSKPNGMRSSWPFGYVKAEDATYSTNYGSRLGNETFEPADDVKGNIARSVLYFFLRYNDREIFINTDGNEFFTSRISQFFDWHKQDPPDPWERARNNAIEKYQGNRNPFIDFPAFTDLIGTEPFVDLAASKVAAQAEPEIDNAATTEEPQTSSNEKSEGSYYNGTENLSGQALFDKLHDLTGRNYKIYGYKTAKSYMYHYIDNPEKNKVRTLYSGIVADREGNKFVEHGDANGDGTSNDFVNCEHTWPQSKFGKIVPMVSDIHHLYPTFSKPNGMRSSWPFGIVDHASYSTSAGSKLGHGTFEPKDDAKGNVARALLYFYMRYHDKSIFMGTDSNDFFKSRINQFMKWNKMDPPDNWEKERNNRIHDYQGNRNPFIDHPEFLDKIGEAPFRN